MDNTATYANDKQKLLVLLRDPEVQQQLKALLFQSENTFPASSRYGQQHLQQAHANDQARLLAEKEDALQQQVRKIEEQENMIKELEKLWKKFESLFTQEAETNQTLQQALSQCRAEIDTQAQRYKQLEQQLQTREQQYQQLQTQLEALKPLKELQPLHEQAYVQFLQLGSETREQLKGIFPQASFNVFIVAGVQHKNLESLYEYIKNAIMEGGHPDEDRLITIYKNLLDNFVKAHPRYEIDTPELKQPFDPACQVSTPDSPPSGLIKQVLLPGWKVKSNQKRLKYPIVKLNRSL